MTITWYGHCCFLFEEEHLKLLTDPYDDFLDISLGKVDADFMTISSIWHDHGNIAASPQAHIYAYEGSEGKNGIKVTGIKSKEARGSSTIIFNILFENFSITNFADWGQPESIKQFSEEETATLAQTDIALVRANAIDDEETLFFYELALQVCNPKFIIPCHYYPRNFVEQNLPPEEQFGYQRKLTQIEDMIQRNGFNRMSVQGYSFTPNLDEIESPTVIHFEEIHPQVQYMKK